jgi:hypothetical protein
VKIVLAVVIGVALYVALGVLAGPTTHTALMLPALGSLGSFSYRALVAVFAAGAFLRHK